MSANSAFGWFLVGLATACLAVLALLIAWLCSLHRWDGLTAAALAVAAIAAVVALTALVTASALYCAPTL